MVENEEENLSGLFGIGSELELVQDRKGQIFVLLLCHSVGQNIFGCL